jgi:hypothetical protein
MFSHRTSNRPPVEELIIYALLMITGAIPVTNALEAGGHFGVEPTIGALMIGAGVIGVIMYAWSAAHRGGDAPAAQEASNQGSPAQSAAGAGVADGGSRNR